MITFEKPGMENTARTLELAWGEAVRIDAPLLVATTTGSTAMDALAYLKERGGLDRLVIISHAYGTRRKGDNAMPEAQFKALRDESVRVVTAAHALSGAERAMSTKFTGVYPVEVIAHSLRMLSQGVKVAVEIGAMALDAGAIPYGRRVVAVAGTGRGADTATVLTPEYTQDVLGTKIHEILCKPYLGEQ